MMFKLQTRLPQQFTNFTHKYTFKLPQQKNKPFGLFSFNKGQCFLSRSRETTYLQLLKLVALYPKTHPRP